LDFGISVKDAFDILYDQTAEAKRLIIGFMRGGCIG